MQPELISEQYAALNTELHERNEAYGTSGHQFAPHVIDLATETGATTILDYGCGKETLRKEVEKTRRDLKVVGYDPCIDGMKDTPIPQKMVVCTDVLEHIEPEYLDNVLDDLKRVTEGIGLFTVATIGAKKYLADGRNAHLIIEKADWWLPKIMDRFNLLMFQNFSDRAFMVIVEAK